MVLMLARPAFVVSKEPNLSSCNYRIMVIELSIYNFKNFFFSKETVFSRLKVDTHLSANFLLCIVSLPIYSPIISLS